MAPIFVSRGKDDGPEGRFQAGPCTPEPEIEPWPEESELYLAGLTSLLGEWNSVEDAADFGSLGGIVARSTANTILHVIPGPRKRNPGSITAEDPGQSD